MIATYVSSAIDTLTDNVMTMTARKDAGTDMKEIIHQSMTGKGMTGVKETEISDGIKSEDFSVEKSVGRQQEITTQRRLRKTKNQKKLTRH